MSKGAKVAALARVTLMMEFSKPDLCARIMRISATVGALGSLPALLPAQAAPPATDTSNRVAVVVFAEATAGSVTFRGQPQLQVRLLGGLDSIHVLDRHNLPNPVVSGTTYRDVHVAVEIFGRVNADCIARTLAGQREPAVPACVSLELNGTRSPSDSTRPPKSK